MRLSEGASGLSISRSKRQRHQKPSSLSFDMVALSRNFRINIVAETSNNIKSLLEEKPMSLTRRRALQALSALPAAGLIGGLSRPARAAEFSLKYGNNLPLTHPLNIRAQEAADR